MADLETLLHELRALGDPIPQSRVLALLRSFTGQRIYFARNRLVKPEQVRLAGSLLAAGMCRADAARALVERLQIHQSTAYELLQEALNERAKPLNGHHQEDLFR